MICLVTGATSGIGKSTAEEFARNGHQLIITGRREERLAAFKKTLENAFGIYVHTLCFDVRQPHEVEAAIQSIPASFLPLDVLVNNAGLAAGLSSIQEGRLEHWERMIDTNVKGLLYVTRAVAPLMVKAGKGHIINIGSVAGKEVYPNGNVYCATKHAVDALNKGMRMDLLPQGIRVSAINPGMVETEFSVVRFDGDAERAKKVYAGMQPLRPADVADAVYWAATRSPHVNINDILIMPSVQATATQVIRKSD